MDILTCLQSAYYLFEIHPNKSFKVHEAWHGSTINSNGIVLNKHTNTCVTGINTCNMYELPFRLQT